MIAVQKHSNTSSLSQKLKRTLSRPAYETKTFPACAHNQIERMTTKIGYDYRVPGNEKQKEKTKPVRKRSKKIYPNRPTIVWTLLFISKPCFMHLSNVPALPFFRPLTHKMRNKNWWTYTANIKRLSKEKQNECTFSRKTRILRYITRIVDRDCLA